jgi:hypothetical protein
LLRSTKVTDIRRDLTDHVRRVIAEVTSCNEEDDETPCRNTKLNSQMRNRSAVSGYECVKANDNKEHNVQSRPKVACNRATCCDTVFPFVAVRSLW